MLQRLLNTHPDLFIPPEATVIPLLYDSYQHRTHWDSTLKKKFVKDVCRDNKITEWWELSQSAIDDALQHRKIASFRDALVSLYHLPVNDRSVAFLGDKNPANSLYIDKLLSVFPQAKFIYLTRDPLDNVNSFQHVSFDSDNAVVLAHRWDYYNTTLLQWEQEKPSQFLRIKFEDLVGETSVQLNHIADFLGVQHQFDISKKESGNQPWQSNLDAKISPKHVGKGRKGLSQTEVQHVTDICADTANRLGYPFTPSGKPKKSVKAWFFSYFEQNYIRLPLFLSTFILRFYRKRKKIIRED